MLEQPLTWTLAIGIALFLWLVARSRPAGEIVRNGDRTPCRPSISAVRRWGYQLQNLDVAGAATTAFDLLVIDHARDKGEPLSRFEIEQLQRKPDGSRRLVLAYVSIGEAERYRSYWDAGWSNRPPAWLRGENPDWPGNYAVRFWDAEWQALMRRCLGRVQAQGFDGFYLDKCDVFEDLRARDPMSVAKRTDLERDMVAFIRAIAGQARSHDPAFLIVMQNAEALLVHEDLVETIDGVAKEELLFGIERPSHPNGSDEIAFAKACLDRVKRKGKPVFVVEYLADPAKARKASAVTKDFGYVLYVAPVDRELKRLNFAAPGT